MVMRHAEVPAALQMARPGAAGAAPSRVMSVDALRGFNIFWIIGGDGAILALDRMLQHKGPLAAAVGRFLGTQMSHSPWEGFRFYDFIFPLFIFVVGVSVALSLTRLVEREGRAMAHLRVLRRALLLFVLGIIYYGGFGSHFGDIRVLGVLQRIAISYLFASLLFLNLNWRGLVAAFVALLVGYWALMMFVPVPDLGAGVLAPNANLADWIDANYLPGLLWDKTRDPEGLLGSLPAIASCLAGLFAGLLLRDGRVKPQAKVLWLIGGGALSVAAGELWGLEFPVIKPIWTSSFVLVAAGWSAILLGVLYQVVDLWGVKRWATVFVWIGANAITLYFINGVFGFEPFARRLVGGDVARFFDATLTPGSGALITHLVGIAIAVMLAGYLYRRKIFLKV
jgi:predicted acyltransferase